MNPKLPDALELVQTKQSIKNDEKEIVYQLALNYEDPFLKTGRVKQSTKTDESLQIKRNEKPKVVKQNNQLRWPEIKYFGFIKSDNETKAITLINGQNLIVQELDTIFPDIILKHINRDSIYLEQNSKIKVIGII